MDEKDKEMLITKRVQLVENIVMEELLTHLIAKKVVTKRQAESIVSYVTLYIFVVVDINPSVTNPAKTGSDSNTNMPFFHKF